MVNPERDAPERFQVGIEELKDRFAALDNEVRAGGEVVVRGIGQMIPALAKMEPFLSRKGEHHEPHYVKMLIAAGLPTWEAYKKQIAQEFEVSVRTVQRKLAEHRGHPKERQARRLSDENGSGGTGNARSNRVQTDATRNLVQVGSELEAAASSAQATEIIAEYGQAVATGDPCALTDTDAYDCRGDNDGDARRLLALGSFDGRDEAKTSAELLTDHTKILLEVLTGTSVMSDSMRITRAATLVKDLQRALEEGFLVVPSPAPTSKAPLLEGEGVSERVRGAYSTLCGVFSSMADTTDIENTLQDSLKEFILPMLDQHPYKQIDTPYRPELQISATFHRAGRARISAGDWVEYRGGDDRLRNQIGSETALGRVVGADGFSRPRVTWFNGAKWVKPYALFDEEAVHILFAEQAAVLYPNAFNSYSVPTSSKPPSAIATMEADASASSAPSAVAAVAESVGANGMEDAGENRVVSNAISPSPEESVAENNLPPESAGPVTLDVRTHGEAKWTQLLPGKKYQVRPAPSGGYGIYEARSTVLRQWYVEEDEARGAIDSVIATAACA